MKQFKNVVLLGVFAFVLLAMALPVNAEDTGKININTASADQLVQLKGVGPDYAAAIVAYREAEGPFKAPEDLMKVKGIGPKTFETNKDMIVVEDSK